MSYRLNFNEPAAELNWADEHRINYGRLHPGKTYKADCTCGWTAEGERKSVIAAVRKHETDFC